ncbi:MAG: hypothetical protein DYG90_13540, partial [Chloroflexi bacterium CFX6]|nr:hypothetical protein [Chloroflexi bacterium CFX6]
MKEDATGRFFGGITFSTNFPTTAGVIQPTALGTPDWYVAKFNTNNDTLLWSTFLGSSSSDYGGHLVLLANGNIVVAGHALNAHSGVGFGGSIPPIALNATASSTYQAVVYEMNSTGTARVRSVRFGGNTTTYVGGIEHNPTTGDYYVVGETFVSCTVAGSCGLGPAGGFQPVQTGLDTASGYATRLNSTLDTATAFTYMAGNSTDGLIDAKIDGSGNVYLAGPTFSTTFPFATTLIGSDGGYNFLIAKLDASLATASYNPVRIGGSSTDCIIGFSYFAPITSMLGQEVIEVAADGRVAFVGATLSTNFPTAGTPYQSSNPGNYAYAVGVLNAAGTDLDESTYFGGSSTDYGRDIGFNANGNIWVTGGTASANFPVANAVQAANAGNYDYGTVLFAGNMDTSAIIASTYWGGLSTDIATNIVPGPTTARARISGDTFLSTPSFPDVPAGAPFFGTSGSYDGGVFDLNFGGANLSVNTLLSTVEGIPATHEFDCLTAGDYLVINLVLRNTGLSNQNDNAGPEFVGSVSGQLTVTGCTASSGTCTLVGRGLEWNGAIASGGSVTITVTGRFNGGIPAGSEACIEGTLFFDTNEDDVNDASRAIAPFCAVTDCPPTVQPNKQLGSQVHLPIL